MESDRQKPSRLWLQIIFILSFINYALAGTPILAMFSVTSHAYERNIVLTINAKGSSAAGEYAHLKAIVNGVQIGATYTTGSYQLYQFPLNINTGQPITVKVVFDNDAVVDGQDRNLYVQSIDIGETEIIASSENVIYQRKDGSIIPYNGIMPWSGDLIFEMEAQTNVCEGDITLSSQAEVDAFNCTEVTGSLTISGSDIINLQALSVLQTIGGGLYIENNNLLGSLDGLQVQGVLSDIGLSNNSKLLNIDALKAIEGVGLSLTISQNPLLTDINAFAQIKSVRFVTISQNEALQNVDGLRSLTNVRGIVIKDNAALMHINGLSSLVEVEFGGEVTGNTSLTNFCGLYNLVATGNRTLLIENNAINPSFDEILSNGLCEQDSYVFVNAKGSNAGGQYASFKVYINDQLVGESYTTAAYETYQFGYSFVDGAQIKVRFDNDAVINGQDRNLYVQSIEIGGVEMPASPENIIYQRKDGSIIPYNGVMPWSGDLIFEIEAIPQVCEGDFTLNTQAEVDAFNCTEVTGNLIISGGDITNLDGLSELRRVGKDLRILNNPILKNILGLSSLASIKYNLEIEFNEALESLEGLDALKECKYLNIIGNSNLKNLTGLGGIELLWNVAIVDNENLESTLGLSSLKTIDDILYVEGNPALVALNGFGSMSKLPFNITIRYNANLNDISFLSKLEFIELLKIQNNGALQNLDFLASLSTAMDIEISGNPNLLNVDGLSNLTAVNNDFKLFDNENLVSCCGIYPFISAGGATANTIIENNGAGCTAADILANGPCSSETTLTVNVKGSQAGGQYAHYKVYVNNDIVGDVYTTSTYEAHQYSGLGLDANDISNIEITFDNDAVINGQDRNLYVQSIKIGDREIPATPKNVTYRRTNGSIIPYSGIMPWSGDLIFDIGVESSASARMGDLNNELTSHSYTTEPEFTIYPNPSNGIFNVDVGNLDAAMLNIEVIDQTGRSVFNKQIESVQNQALEMNLYSLPNGIYFLRVSADTFMKVQRIVKN